MRMYGCITLICTIGAQGIGKTGLCAVMNNNCHVSDGTSCQAGTCACVCDSREGLGLDGRPLSKSQ